MKIGGKRLTFSLGSLIMRNGAENPQGGMPHKSKYFGTLVLVPAGTQPVFVEWMNTTLLKEFEVLDHY